MEMKRKNVVSILVLLGALGIAICFETQVDAYTFSETIEFKPVTPTVSKAYTGPQTVQALMRAFDAEYNRRHAKTTVSVSGRKPAQFTVQEIDVRYPRAAWLQALLDKGIRIKNFHEYASYLAKRHTLAFLEDNPDLRKTEFFRIPTANDWIAYKAAYIDKLVSLIPPNAPMALRIPQILNTPRPLNVPSRGGFVPFQPLTPNTLRPLNVLSPLNPPMVPRIPQLFTLNHLTELEKINLSSLQRLVNQLEQTVEDLERQNRQDTVEQIKEALEHAKKALEQIKTLKSPSTNTPEPKIKRTSRYPPL